MSSTILLVRHCENDAVGHTLVGWTPGIHLNARGREQAAELAERLAGVPIRAIYSSPLERARETAEPLAARLGIEVRVCEDVGEIRLGAWTGRSLRELADDPEWREFNAHRSTARIPGGESMLEVQSRMVNAFSGIRAAYPEDVVVVVSHGDPIRAALLYYLGMPIDFVHRLEAHTASVSVIRFNDWGPQVLRVNDTGQLP